MALPLTPRPLKEESREVVYNYWFHQSFFPSRTPTRTHTGVFFFYVEHSKELHKWHKFSNSKDTMVTRIIHFLCIVLTVLPMAGGLAHLYAIPNKMHLSQADYLIAQQIFAGWALLGIPIIIDLILLIVLAMIWRNSKKFYYILIAALCIALGLMDFFIFTNPVNHQTNNWTLMPQNWESLRRQWEYSHAVGAFFYFSAFILLLIPSIFETCNKKHYPS